MLLGQLCGAQMWGQYFHPSLGGGDAQCEVGRTQGHSHGQSPARKWHGLRAPSLPWRHRRGRVVKKGRGRAEEGDKQLTQNLGQCA